MGLCANHVLDLSSVTNLGYPRSIQVVCGHHKDGLRCIATFGLIMTNHSNPNLLFHQYNSIPALLYLH